MTGENRSNEWRGTDTTWKIINNEKGTTQHDMSVPSLVMNEK